MDRLLWEGAACAETGQVRTSSSLMTPWSSYVALDSCWMKHRSCQCSDGYQHRGHVTLDCTAQQWTLCIRLPNVIQAHLQRRAIHNTSTQNAGLCMHEKTFWISVPAVLASSSMIIENKRTVATKLDTKKLETPYRQ